MIQYTHVYSSGTHKEGIVCILCIYYTMAPDVLHGMIHDTWDDESHYIPNVVGFMYACMQCMCISHLYTYTQYMCTYTERGHTLVIVQSVIIEPCIKHLWNTLDFLLAQHNHRCTVTLVPSTNALVVPGGISAKHFTLYYWYSAITFAQRH